MELRTGIPQLDSLLGGGLYPGITEFYSDHWSLVSLLYHRMLVSLAPQGDVLLLLNREFGGLDPHLLRRIARRLGIPRSSVDSIRVLRTFSLQGLLLALEGAAGEPWDALLVVDPYLQVDPSRMAEAGPVTASLSRLRARGNVVLFNRANGSRPHGGNFHHHTVSVLVRLRRARGGALAVLEKHPSRPRLSTGIPTSELLGVAPWAGRPLPCAGQLRAR